METRKSKVTAVVLAIFLGFWAYTYTYSKDRRKFWILFWLTFAFICVFISSVMQTINAGSSQTWCNLGKWELSNQELGIGSSECDVYKPDFTWFNISLIALLIIWGLTIIDRVRKPKEYYSN